MREHGVLGLHPSSIRSKIAGVRFYHIMAGSVDFSSHGLRHKQLLQALQKKRPVQRKLPVSPDMLAWFHQYMSFAWDDERFAMIWDALILGFTFLLRGSEIKNLRWRDVSFCEGDGQSYLAICIQKSKTDQEGKGVIRSLFQNDTALCPYRSLEGYSIGLIKESKMPEAFVFPRNILAVVRSTIKWFASSLGLDADFPPIHSLRSGGASALFSNGVELEIIRRFGRWRSSQFHPYLYGGSINFRKLSSVLRQETILPNK